MPPTSVDARLDLSDPDLLADHLPARRVRLAASEPTHPVEPAGVRGRVRRRRILGHHPPCRRHGGDEESGVVGGEPLGFRSAAGRIRSHGGVNQEPLAVHGPTSAHASAPSGEPVLHAASLGRSRKTTSTSEPTGSSGPPSSDGTGDFVIDVARHLPLQAIAGLMGIPRDDRQRLFDWSDQMAGSEDPEYASSELSGVVEMFAYAHAAAEARLENDLGDVTSRLVQPDASGHRLSSEEFAFFFMILAVAGNETTRQAITHGMLAFLEHPDQWERWRSERPASAIDEILRWASPAVVLQRTATEDTEVAGRVVREGERVGLYFASANFDEDVFEDPRRFDIGRSPNPHVTFGAGGSHFCIGANLTRLELKVMFDVIADELAETKLIGAPRRLRSSWLNGIKHLPVRYGGSP